MESVGAVNDCAYLFSTFYNKCTAREALMTREQAFEETQRKLLIRTGRVRYPGGWYEFAEEIDFLGDQINDMAHY
jgi:hypothetical protein